MRRGVVVAGVLAVLAGGAAAYAWLGGGDGRAPRGGSVAAPGPSVEIEREPVRYRVRYRVEDHSGDRVQVTTDRVWVRRPFESRLETWTGEPPGNEQLAVQIAAFARLATASVDQDRLVTAVPPGVPASDTRVAPVLQEALAAGVVEQRERREVLDRPCQVYRSKGFFTAATLEPPAAEEYAETCLDRNGIALEEVLYLNGALRHRRVVVDLSLEPRLDDELFGAGDPTVRVEEGGGSVREVDPATRSQGEFWEAPDLDAGLDGYEYRGRYSVIPPQAENFSNPVRRDHIVTGVSDVWVDGADFVVVDQGGTLRGAAPFVLGERTPRVAVGDLGEGEVLLSSRGNEVRVLLGEGRYLRVYGPVPTEELAEVARRLRRVEGDGLVYLDDRVDQS